MDLMTLCSSIGLQREAAERVAALDKTLPETPLTQAILEPVNARDAHASLCALCPEDDLGYTILTYQLRAAVNTYDRYLEKGIDPAVFTATMGCYPRFLGEHLRSFGTYGFDRGWWTYRQLSMTLFRLGELELEYRDDQHTIHLHIPSGARIDLASCRASFEAMERFTADHYPDKAGYRYMVDSWLLSPALREVLGEDSRILRFQQCFTLEQWDPEGDEFMQWVYGRTDIPYAELPEETTLQRKLKQYLLRGGRIGSAWGYLRIGFK